jgi:REase_DpnII-MboI
MATPVQHLQEQLDAIGTIEGHRREWHFFQKWHRDTEVVIERVFGKSSRHAADFHLVRFTPIAVSSGTSDATYDDAYRRGLEHARAVLTSMVEELQKFGQVDTDMNCGRRLGRIFTSFHAVVLALRARREDRPTLDVDDEYDVQDLLRALLQVDFDDVRPEEPVQSHAGSGSRMDFLLKKERVVVEAKKTRKGLDAKKLSEELIVDIERYRKHSDCGALYCFVYDPEHRLANPTSIESDLSRDEPFPVRVVVRPQARSA